MWGIFDFGKKKEEKIKGPVKIEVLEEENSPQIVEVSKTPEQIKKEQDDAARMRHKVLDAKPEAFLSEMEKNQNEFLKDMFGKNQ